MEASEKKVSTRVRGAVWRRKDAPKARGVSFPGRHGRVEEQGEMNKKNSKKIGKNEMLMEARNIYERRKREAYYICFIFFGIF